MSCRINFIGRLGADAELVTTGATPFISCRVAVDESTAKEKSTRWISVNADSIRYKNLLQYLTKGKLLYITGVERVSAYTSKTGEIGVDTRVWADSIDFIPIGNKQGSDETPQQHTQQNVQDQKNAQMTTGKVKSGTMPPTQMPGSPAPDFGDSDDLPF
jgi:single stranded DNA-binding protein